MPRNRHLKIGETKGQGYKQLYPPIIRVGKLRREGEADFCPHINVWTPQLPKSCVWLLLPDTKPPRLACLSSHGVAGLLGETDYFQMKILSCHIMAGIISGVLPEISAWTLEFFFYTIHIIWPTTLSWLYLIYKNVPTWSFHFLTHYPSLLAVSEGMFFTCLGFNSYQSNEGIRFRVESDCAVLI